MIPDRARCERIMRCRRRGGVVAWLAVLAVLAPGLAGCGPSNLVVDNEQSRLDRAAPTLQGEHTAGQTFVAHAPRLDAVEILLVVYDPQPDQPQSLVFHLRQSPGATEDLATVRVDSHTLRHNQPQRFAFSPIQESAGRSYYFFLEGSAGNRATAWSSSADVYGDGSLWIDGQAQAGDLNFKTFYDEDAEILAQDLGHAAAGGGWLVVPLLALFLLPGAVVLLAAGPRGSAGWAERLSLAAGVSLALMPVVLLWTTVVGWQWDSLKLRAALVVVAVAGAGLAWRGWADRGASGGRSGRAPGIGSEAEGPAVQRWPSALSLALLAVMAVSVALRVLQVRELALPAWIDSVHHAAMAKLIADAGAIPATYAPLGPDVPFLYHYGFHSAVAGLMWLTGLDIPQAELIAGQMINVWTVLAMLLLALRLTGRPVADVVAALVTGAIAWMPSYFVTWGRYTQLAGLAILPAAVALTLDALDEERHPRRAASVAGVAAAGLLLTHYRVILWFVTWLAAHLVLESVARRRAGLGVRGLWARAAAVGLTGLVVAAPWLARLWTGLVSTGLLPLYFQGADSSNAVPRALIELPRNQSLLVLAGLGWLLTLAARRRLALLVPLWAALLFLPTNPRAIGLPSSWLFSNSSQVINLFVPISLLVGAGAAVVVAALERAGEWAAARLAARAEDGQPAHRPGPATIEGRLAGTTAEGAPLRRDNDPTAGPSVVGAALPCLPPSAGEAATAGGASSGRTPATEEETPVVRDGPAMGPAGDREGRKEYRRAAWGRQAARLARLAGGAAIAAIAVWSGWGLVHIVNPVTVLATRDDVTAMSWVRDNLPRDARFLVNTRFWQGTTYVGSDGGYWLPVLTGRETVMPSVLYTYGGAEVLRINADARAVADAAKWEDTELQRVIRERGLTHAYIGAKGGKLTPQMLLAAGEASGGGTIRPRPVYSNGAVWIFELETQGQALDRKPDGGKMPVAPDGRPGEKSGSKERPGG